MIKNILVTGGLGFIGSHFIKHILKNFPSYSIVNVDKLTYAGNKKNLEGLPVTSLCYVDIKDEAIKDILQDYKIDTIVNFAAESHVDRSVKYPKEFIETEVLGLFNLVYQSIKNKNINLMVHVSCYDTNTRALTTHGLKRYDEIKVGDRVLSLNPETLEIEEKDVEEIIIQDYDGKMINFKNKRIDVSVTPNHNMFILNSGEKLVKEAAAVSAKRSTFRMPEGKWRGMCGDSVRIEGLGNVNTRDFMYLLGIYLGDGFCGYQEKVVENKSGCARQHYLEFGRDNMGRFKSGKLGDVENSISKSYRIFLDIPENDECRKRVEKTLTDLNIIWHSQKGKAGEHLYFSSEPLLNFFSMCGIGAKNKFIPRWILQYSPEYLKFLFDGLLDSDGHKYRIFNSSSEKLIAGFCELCFKLGLKPTIGKRHSISFIKNRKIEGDGFWVSVGKTKKSIVREKIKETQYSGKIWCLKVKDNKNFIVERNGKLDFCGNTDEVYGDSYVYEADETFKLDPNSPYAASKACADLLLQSYSRTYDFPAVIVRPCNNFGPRQYPEKLVPMVITRLLENQEVLVHGRGIEKREWIYVEDCCRAIEAVMHFGKVGEIYNIGSGNRLTNMQVVETLIKLVKGTEKYSDFIKHMPNRPGNDIGYAINSDRVKKICGDYLKTDFLEGMKTTVDWYKTNWHYWSSIDLESNIYDNENYLR